VGRQMSGAYLYNYYGGDHHFELLPILRA